MVVSGFDYLRDNLALSREEAVLSQRPLDKAYCLVDEVTLTAAPELSRELSFVRRSHLT